MGWRTHSPGPHPVAPHFLCRVIRSAGGCPGHCWASGHWGGETFQSTEASRRLGCTVLHVSEFQCVCVCGGGGRDREVFSLWSFHCVCMGSLTLRQVHHQGPAPTHSHTHHQSRGSSLISPPTPHPQSTAQSAPNFPSRFHILFSFLPTPVSGMFQKNHLAEWPPSTCKTDRLCLQLYITQGVKKK